jgi:hypothetical protein
MGIFVFRRKTPRRENIYPPELSQFVTVSSVKGIKADLNQKVIKIGIGIFTRSEPFVYFTAPEFPQSSKKTQAYTQLEKRAL